MGRWKNIKQQFFTTIDKQIKEKPFKVALGCTLGLGINFFPTLGIGFVFAFVLAAILKVNRSSAAVTSLLTAPQNTLMYALNLFTGGLILTPGSGKENLVEFVVSQYSIILKLGDIHKKIFGFLEFFGSTFLLGAVVNAALFGIAFYYLVDYMLSKRGN